MPDILKLWYDSIIEPAGGRRTGNRNTVLRARKALSRNPEAALGPLQSLSFLYENSALQRVPGRDNTKETMPSDAPTARASSFDFATKVAKRPRRPGASTRQRRMDIYQVPLRGPDLISHGLYVWRLLSVLRGPLAELLPILGNIES